MQAQYLLPMDVVDLDANDGVDGMDGDDDVVGKPPAAGRSEWNKRIYQAMKTNPQKYEKRKKMVTENMRKYRAKMTPEQIMERKRKDNEQKKKKRQAEKERKQMAQN